MHLNMKKTYGVFLMAVLLTLTAFKPLAPQQGKKLLIITHITDLTDQRMVAYPMPECSLTVMDYNGKDEFTVTGDLTKKFEKKYAGRKILCEHTTNYDDMSKRYVVILWASLRDSRTGKYVKFYIGKIGAHRKEAYESALKIIKTNCGETARVYVQEDKQY